MKKIKFLIMIAFVLSVKATFAQDIYVSEAANISFYSKTPMEDIDAVSKKAVTAINKSTGQVYFKVQNTSFDFKAKLMQEHFNENYMESEKYPYSEFKGQILDIKKTNLKKPGTYRVKIEGKLNMHGVEKTYIVPATIVVNKDGKMNATADFKVKLADHKIQIPTLVVAKIAETIDIKLAAEYQAKSPA